MRSALAASLEWARGESYPVAVVGGVAVCLQGPIRPTNDVDILVFTDDDPQTVVDSLERAGFTPRYADPVEFALATRVALVRHSGSGVAVNVMLGMIPFEEECINTAVNKQTGGNVFPVVTPEALCVMKLIAGRPRDLRDVALLIETYPELDRAWVLHHVRQFSELSESPESLARASEMLSDDLST